MFKKKVVLVVLLVLALLVSACGPAALTGAEMAPTEVATQEPTVAPTNTPEPTATQVVEYPSPDQEWFVENVFPVAWEAFERAEELRSEGREVGEVPEGGYTPYYETTYYPEVAHIPWTVDAEGNTVQGITYLHMCSTGSGDKVYTQTEPPYLGLFRLGTGYSQRSMDWTLENWGVLVWSSPTFNLSVISLEIPQEYLGFLSPEDSTKLGSYWHASRVAAGYENNDGYPEVLIPICQALAEIYPKTHYQETKVGMGHYNIED